jgi:hypothetical protein
MIQYQLFDTFANELNIGDIILGTFPNEKIKVLGELSLSNQHELILDTGNGSFEPFHVTHMKVEKIAHKSDIPRLISMRGRHQFNRKSDADKWQRILNRILDEYLNG